MFLNVHPEIQVSHPHVAKIVPQVHTLVARVGLVRGVARSACAAIIAHSGVDIPTISPCLACGVFYISTADLLESTNANRVKRTLRIRSPQPEATTGAAMGVTKVPVKTFCVSCSIQRSFL